jgi:GH25 family lysozyme M1 (1,4-beta-N-acetylmuramidase)
MSALFADISAYQQTVLWNQYIPWSKEGDGVSRVMMRATYGNDVDAYFTTHAQGAHDNRINRLMCYSYAYPQYVAAATAAQTFWNTVRPFHPDELYLDIEENVPEASSGYVLAFLEELRSLYDGVVGVYASDSYIRSRLHDPRLAPYQLWLAYWNFDPALDVATPPPWSSQRYRQFSDKGTVPGIAGNVDLNVVLAQREVDNKFMDQAAHDEWVSFFERTLNKQSPRWDTAIFASWKEHLRNGQHIGPPITEEYQSVNWLGEKIIVQQFADGRCEWDGTAAHWFSTDGAF